MPDNMYPFGPYRKNCSPPKPPKEKVKMNKHKKAAIGYGSIIVIIISALLGVVYHYSGWAPFIQLAYIVAAAVAIFGFIFLILAFIDSYLSYKDSKRETKL